MAVKVWEKWDRAADAFDLMNRGIEVRFGEAKREWFQKAKGLTLLAAAGTGIDFQYLPEQLKVTGVEISAGMLERAKTRLAGHPFVRLVRTDIEALPFPDGTFDTAVTACTFCSVPDPVAGLKEIYRVLKPGGEMIMFEHVRSDIFWMGPMMDIMTHVTRRFGPDINRRTRDNVIKAGFRLTREINLHLDMVKIFTAVREKDPPGKR